MLLLCVASTTDSVVDYSALMQAAVQAAKAWEQGTSMFGQGADAAQTPTLNTMPVAARDVKRLIASNLETVHWSDMVKYQQEQLKG